LLVAAMLTASCCPDRPPKAAGVLCGYTPENVMSRRPAEVSMVTLLQLHDIYAHQVVTVRGWYAGEFESERLLPEKGAPADEFRSLHLTKPRAAQNFLTPCLGQEVLVVGEFVPTDLPVGNVIIVFAVEPVTP
jgi:hypothetical protein